MREDQDRWAKIQSLYLELVELPATLREAELEKRAAGDPALFEGVQSLLLTERTDQHFLEPPTIAQPRTPSPERAEDLLGRTLGSCTLESILGQGGMGTVYAATQAPWGRRVAVKVLHGGFVSSSARQRFDYEAQLLARLRHPGIAQIFESGTTTDAAGPSVPYIAMEFIPGATTLLHFAQHADLELLAKVQIFQQVLDAVQHGHEQGIVHRDLKPANVLVDQEGRPKVIDFGVARTVGENASDKAFATLEGFIIGTPAFMSPEQISGRRDEVDTRSDVYSLGVIFFELLCGARPYSIENRPFAEISRTICEEPPTRPRSLVASLPDELEAILMKALAKKKEDRYATAADFAEDLRRFSEGLPISARALTAGYQVRLLLRRHRGVLIALSFIFAVAVIGAIVATSFAVEARAARADESRRRREAEHLLAHAQSFASWVVTDFEARLSALPSSTPVREQLAHRIVAYLNELSLATAASEDFRRSLARAYLAVAEVQGSPTNPSLGRPTEALENLRRAREILAALGKASPPEDSLIHLQLAARIFELDLLHALGRTASTTDSYERILGDLARLESTSGGPTQETRGLRAAIELGRVAVAQARGQIAEALTSAKSVTELHRETHTRTPTSSQSRFHLLHAEIVLADLLLLNDQPAPAREAFERAQSLVTGDDRDRASLFRLASDLAVAEGHTEDALKNAEESLRLRAERAALDPENAGYKHREFVARERLLILLVKTSATERASSEARTNVLLAIHLAANAPTAPESIELKRTAKNRLANLQLMQLDFDAAQKTLEEVVEEVQIMERHPEATATLKTYAAAETAETRGILHLRRSAASQNLDESSRLAKAALSDFEKALALYESLPLTHPGISALIAGTRKYLDLTRGLLPPVR